jgi:hypothetical protein
MPPRKVMPDEFQRPELGFDLSEKKLVQHLKYRFLLYAVHWVALKLGAEW